MLDDENLIENWEEEEGDVAEETSLCTKFENRNHHGDAITFNASRHV